jgi:uncharacterized UBP type Zn finger protein
MIGQYLEKGSKPMAKKQDNTTWRIPTKCATCKYSTRNMGVAHALAPFMAFCDNNNSHHDRTTAFGDLVYTHIRKGMRVPEQDCNVYEEKENV